MSHTVKVDIKFTNIAAVEQAAKTMNAQVIGYGSHRLYGGQEEGFAIKLQGWQYPIIIHKDGSISYDNYNGAWGDIEKLEDLQSWYSLAVAELVCKEQGWYTEFNPALKELVAHHPSGGTITVGPGGNIDANGFTGATCAEATQKLEEALGTKVNESLKPEYNQTRITQKAQE